MMSHLIYLAVIAILVGISVFLWLKEHRAVSVAEREKEEIEIEEHRMFDFLHGLGEELQEDTDPRAMHQYIIDGVSRVVDAEAGALYLHDAKNRVLVPVAITENPPPLVQAKQELLQSNDLDDGKKRYRSFMRLNFFSETEGPIGQTLTSGKLVSEVLPRYTGELHPYESALLAAPLVYGQKKVGVVAVTRPSDRPFSENDQDVFSSIAEQSSIALGSAIVHADAHEKRRLERELAQASEIQKVLLPKEEPDLTDYGLAAAYRAAHHLSGDYYDYVTIDEDRYGVVIGDVCGKGIAASLIMAMCRSNLRANASDNLSPASVLHAVNASIFPDIKEDMFVSLLYLVLERQSNEITLARAGHEPPLLLRQGAEELEPIEPPGMAAGVDRGNVFKRIVKDHRFQMEKGDVLLLYTDGVIEAANRDGDEFGYDALCDLFKRCQGQDAQQIIKTIMGVLDEFTKGARASDDITLIALEKR